jgi:hypothetical protein
MTQAPSSIENPTASEAALHRVLKSAPQDLWLDTIRRTKGAEHDGLIFWMLNQPQCDFAIAVHAFYRSDPGMHLDIPRPLPARPGPSDLFAQVLLNWDTGYYRTHDLAIEKQDVDPRLLVRIGQKVMARPRGSLPFNIPPRFLQPQGGRPAQVPPHLSPDDAKHLWPLYANLGLRVPPAAPGLKRKIAKVRDLLQIFKSHSRGL